MKSTPSDWMQQHLHFTRFLVVGSLNTLLDFSLFFIFANLAGVSPVLASIISTGLTMCVSFYLNHRFVFQSNKKKRHTLGQFVFVTLFNVWVVQSSIIALVIYSFQHSSFFIDHVWTLNLLAKLCGIAVSFVLNFVMYRYIFHEKQLEEPPIV